MDMHSFYISLLYLQNIFHLCRTDIAQIDLCDTSSSEDEFPAVELSTTSIERTGETYIEEDHCSSDDEISYYNGDLSLPVFQKGLKGKSFSAVDIVSISFLWKEVILFVQLYQLRYKMMWCLWWTTPHLSMWRT